MCAMGPRKWIHSESAEHTVVLCQLGGESEALDHQAGRTGGGNRPGARDNTPLRFGAERSPQRRRRQCAAPGTRKSNTARGHSCTRTHQTPSTREFHSLTLQIPLSPPSPSCTESVSQ